LLAKEAIPVIQSNDVTSPKLVNITSCTQQYNNKFQCY